MKTLKWIALLMLVCGAACGQYVPVAVNTNTGVFVPAMTTAYMGWTNYVHVPSTSNWLSFSGKTLTGCVTNKGTISGIGNAITNIVVNDVTGTVQNAMARITVAGGSGDTTQWATNPASTNVNMNTFNLYNASALSVTGRLVIGLGVFASSNDVPAPATTNTWNLFAARTNTMNGSIRLFGVNSDGVRTHVGEW